jgi:hypothetical protein
VGGQQIDTFFLSYQIDWFPIVFRWPSNLAASFDSCKLVDIWGGGFLNLDMTAIDSIRFDSCQTYSCWGLLICTWSPRVVSVSGQVPELLSTPDLYQNYPNPFNPRTTIQFALLSRSHVELSVHDILGRPVALLADGMFDPGKHTIQFDGATLPSGVYIYRLSTPDHNECKLMTLLR